jgi:hypothetical protein
MYAVVMRVYVVQHMDLPVQRNKRPDNNERSEYEPAQKVAAGSTGIDAVSNAVVMEPVAYFIVPDKRIDSESDDRQKEKRPETGGLFPVAFAGGIGLPGHIAGQKAGVNTESQQIKH